MTPAQAMACRGAQALYRLGASRVWICGSIARAGRWDDRSDLDFAVEGLAPHRLAEAHGMLARLTARRVNVVPLEDAPAGLRAAIVACRVFVDQNGHAHRTPAPPTPIVAPPVDAPPVAVPSVKVPSVAVPLVGVPSGGAPPVAVPSVEAPSGGVPQVATAAEVVSAVVVPATVPWHERRLATVAGVLIGAGASRVVDFGCGNGRLIELLAEAGVQRLTGIDRDAEALHRAGARLDVALPAAARERVVLRHGSLSRWHDELAGHDAATAVEVIEHLDPPDLEGFVDIAFGRLRPRVLVLTTPNAEFNTLLKSVELRHPEHRFEWTRSQFRAWAAQVAATYGYTVSIRPLGRTYPGYGPVTQLGVFLADQR